MTGYYDVYALDGHAWVEAYVDGIGWLELEPTAYYDGPFADNKTLSADQINDYVERQLRLQEAIGETEFSFQALLAASWQILYLLVTWIGAHLKLIFLNTWLFLAGIGILLLCAWLTWPYVQPRWRAVQIKRRVDSAQTDSDEEAIAVYLQAIDDLLHNAGYKRPPGLTIEKLLDRLMLLEVPIQASSMSSEFNRVYYSDIEVNINLSRYRMLFDSLYSIGHYNLRQRIYSVQGRL
jgi:hypothetical protein